MDPAYIILDVASSVLSNIMADFITGRSKKAQKAEIQRQAMVALIREVGTENRELKIMLNKVMREIQVLSLRNPDFEVSTDTIEPSRPLKELGTSLIDEHSVQNQLVIRLSVMNEIISRRRNEMIRPNESPALNENSERQTELDIPHGWSTPAVEKVEPSVLRAIRETEDRIRLRRLKDNTDE